MRQAIGKLLGVQIAYCDAEGKEQRVWLNLKQVQALAWSGEEIGAKKKGQGGNDKLPTDPNGPGKCEPHVASAIPPLCWWNGSEWVCGDER